MSLNEIHSKLLEGVIIGDYTWDYYRVIKGDTMSLRSQMRNEKVLQKVSQRIPLPVGRAIPTPS